MGQSRGAERRAVGDPGGQRGGSAGKRGCGTETNAGTRRSVGAGDGHAGSCAGGAGAISDGTERPAACNGRNKWSSNQVEEMEVTLWPSGPSGNGGLTV